MLHLLRKGVVRRSRARFAFTLASFALFVTIPSSSGAYWSSSVTFEGHGYGHGLGMGAWGAYGMSLRDPSATGEAIASYYFPGSYIGGFSNVPIRAWLDYDSPFTETLVTVGDPATQATRNTTRFEAWDLSTGTFLGVSDSNWPFWRVRGNGASLRLQKARDAAGSPGAWEAPEQQVATVAGPIEFRPPAPQDSPTKMIQLLAGSTWRYYRGAIRSALVSGQVYTINVASVQEYMYGVMRVEGAPGRWGPSVSEPQPGHQSLRALAIVARSYALNKRAGAGGKEYDLCSSSNCQNYKGWGYLSGSGNLIQLEDARTNAAVDSTTLIDGRPEVLLYGTSLTPILGAYSSSSGGYSKAGSQPYLQPVPDPDDAISANPHHLWRATIAVSSIEQAWPSIGSLTAIEIVQRNGYGDWGGRVVSAKIHGTSGTVMVSGNTMRSKLGLKSDWFRVLPGWEELGGVLTSGPDVSSWGDMRLDVFVRGNDWQLWHRGFDQGWRDWQPLGGVLTSDPGAVSWGQGRIDVFVRGNDNQLWTRSFESGVWNAWRPLGGVLTSGPDAASWGAGRLDVFVRGNDLQLWHRAYQDGVWQPWEPLGGVLTSDPSAVSPETGRIHVFVKGNDSQLWHRSYVSGRWQGWEPLGGVLTSSPDASSWSPSRIDVIVRGVDRQAWRRHFDNGAWQGWDALGGVLGSDPSAVSWGFNRIDIFAKGMDLPLIHRWWDGSSWVPE